jgi:hypothetical protein
MESRAVMGVHYEITHTVVAGAVKNFRESAWLVDHQPIDGSLAQDKKCG